MSSPDLGLTMDFEYSPHRSAGGTLHLLSPSHPQYSLDAFPSIKQLRRSLSRSPSKPSRFQLYTAIKSPNKKSPNNSPLSPSNLSRTFSVNAATESAVKNKFHLRRNAPIRANATRKTSPNSSLRRALSDGVAQVNNAVPPPAPRTSSDGQENNFATEMDFTADPRFELDSEPIKFDLLRADRPNSLSAAMREHLSPAKSSPLKRSDGVMNLDQVNVGSPVAKRRSLHGAAAFGEFDIFDQGFDGAASAQLDSDVPEIQPAMASPARPRSPQKRAFNLRKSTLQHRATTGSNKFRLFNDSTGDSPASPAATRTRSRVSLDGSLPLRGLDGPHPFLPPPDMKPVSHSAPKPHPLSKTLSPSSSASSFGEDMPAPATVLKLPVPKPFPGFSKSLPIGALRPNSRHESERSSSNESFETPEAYKMAKPLPAAFMSTGLISKRNRNVDLPPTSFGSSINMPDTPSKKTTMPHISGTPAPTPGFAKFARPQHEFGSPTTPWSPHPSKASPESFGKGVNIFGSKAVGSNRRASFLSINDNDNDQDQDQEDDFSQSPSRSGPMDTGSGNEDMPPTPTKASTGSGTIRPTSRGKGNSLRSSLFGRRSSLAPDTFVAPNADSFLTDQTTADSKFLSINTTLSSPRESKSDSHIQRPTTPTFSITPCGSPSHTPSSSFGSTMNPRQAQPRPCPSPLVLRSRDFPMSFTSSPANAEPARRATVHSSVYENAVETPQTPMDSFTPPDPSGLTISGEHRGPVMFNLSTNSNSFPPATPTGPRDHGNSFATGFVPGASLSGFFGTDVDTTLTARFTSVQAIGIGEFSQVFRVEKPIPGSPAAMQITRKVGNVWAVKKSKKPYLGQRDRERKIREVEILQALRGNEHIIDLSDTWECKGHLYIQTEFCENGNLKDFLTQTGFKGRLDDFRIWKILLELCQVSVCCA